MEVIVIDSELWRELNQRLTGMEQLLQSITDRKESKTKEKPSYNWIPIDEALKLMKVSRSTWDRHLQHEIKHRRYGVLTWVYLPSIDAWFMDKSIN